jgi:hypothetical protein
MKPGPRYDRKTPPPEPDDSQESLFTEQETEITMSVQAAIDRLEMELARDSALGLDTANTEAMLAELRRRDGAV